VGSRADLDRALLEAKVDVVLMDWADALSLDARLTDKVTTLPVFYGGASGEFARLDTQDRCVLDADKKRAMKLFRAVNRIVYDHAKGQPVDCAQIGGRGVT
jgi:hypothetical protein